MNIYFDWILYGKIVELCIISEIWLRQVGWAI